MRESATWKTMFCVVAAVMALAHAEPPAYPPPPTPEQLKLVGKIMGVGRIKFGMAPSDFTNGSLADDKDAPDRQPGMKYYIDSDLDGVTWGKLPPDHVQLGFYYDHLVDIRLHFNQPFGELLAVTHAAFEKYGTPQWDRWLNVDSYNIQAAHWSGVDEAKISTLDMQLAFPFSVPAGADEPTLAQKTNGLLVLNASNLYFNLRQSHIKDLEQETLKAHDLEKIKGDL